MKTLLEQELNKIGIRTRDDNGNLRSEEDLTEDVMAFLSKCNEEYASHILFTLLTTQAVEKAGEQIEKRRY